MDFTQRSHFLALSASRLLVRAVLHVLPAILDGALKIPSFLDHLARSKELFYAIGRKLFKDGKFGST